MLPPITSRLKRPITVVKNRFTTIYLSYDSQDPTFFSSAHRAVYCFNKRLKDTSKRIYIHYALLILCIKRRINFSQLARYSGKCEQYFRGHFSIKFDFLSFNKSLLKKACSTEVILDFDPSYIKKSGKHTEGLSHFWPGCAGKVKPGLKICDLSALDVTAHTALHLLAVQTIPLADETLMDFCPYIQRTC